jgi:transposase-like protein
MKRHSLTLIDVEKSFGTEEKCSAYIAAARWPEGVRCLKCGSDKVSAFKTNETTRERTNRKGEIREVRVPARHLYQCNNEVCRFQFSATAKTIFDKTHLPLATWFKAIALLANAKKSISAMQMQRDLGVDYKTAWHLDHRIREAMQSEQGLFGGTVEVDATFVGGVYDPRRKRAAYDKQAVAGVIQRKGEAGHSKVKAVPVEREIAAVMTGVIREHVATDAHVMTDEHGAYMSLSRKGYKHQIVAHSKDEWVRGNVHVQGIESFWSLFKRGVIGSFHQVSVKHLHRYLNEFSFRFNNREAEDIFAMIVLRLVIGSALRYAALTGSVVKIQGEEIN